MFELRTVNNKATLHILYLIFFLNCLMNIILSFCAISQLSNKWLFFLYEQEHSKAFLSNTLIWIGNLFLWWSDVTIRLSFFGSLSFYHSFKLVVSFIYCSTIWCTHFCSISKPFFHSSVMCSVNEEIEQTNKHRIISIATYFFQVLMFFRGKVLFILWIS